MQQYDPPAADASGAFTASGRRRTQWNRAFTASGPPPDALEPGFHCVRTHWIRGFMTFQLVRRTRAMLLMVPMWPESGFSNVPPGRGPTS
jgi:hypothetical protein